MKLSHIQDETVTHPAFSHGVPVKLQLSGITLEPVLEKNESGETIRRVKAVAMMNLDPLAAHVPDFLIDFVVKVVAPWQLQKIRSMLMSLDSRDSPFRQRISENPDTYQAIADRVTNYLQDKNQQIN
eukprot:c4951_g1_i2.p2 GENE.c4951_g1_i2~~c4951_g1_i2.p2  ORF type:complete len:127 (-),score=23.56 c4951_g1_i2:18-398(-)